MSSISLDSSHFGLGTDRPEITLPVPRSPNEEDFQTHLESVPVKDESPPPVSERESDQSPAESLEKQEAESVTQESPEESSEENERPTEDQAEAALSEGPVAEQAAEEDLVAGLENELVTGSTDSGADSGNETELPVEVAVADLEAQQQFSDLPVEDVVAEDVKDVTAKDVITVEGELTGDPDAESVLPGTDGGPQQVEAAAPQANPVETAPSATLTTPLAQDERPADPKPVQENPTNVAGSQGIQEVASLETPVEVRSSNRGDSEGKDPNRGPLPNLESAAAPRQEPSEGSPAQRFADHLFPRGVSDAEGEPQLSGAERVRFVDRVARAIHAAEGRRAPVRMRLHPPELGGLKLELKVQGGALTAKLEAESAVARTVLLDNLPLLRERLLDQGVRIEQFDVDLTDQSWGQPTGHEGEETGQERSHSSTGGELEEVAESEPRSRRGDEQLDVVI